MIICRRPLILATDVAGFAAGAALVCAGIVLIGVPFAQARAELPGLHARIQEARGRKESLVRETRAVQDTLERARAVLRQRAEVSCSDVSRFMEYLSTHCREAGLDLKGFEPLAARAQTEFQSWDVEVRASGSFPAFQRLLANVEAWSEFSSIRELRISTGDQRPTSNGGETVCQLDWAVRVNYLPPETGKVPR